MVTVDRKPILWIEVKTGETTLSNTLKNRKKWFPDQPTLVIQVVDKRETLRIKMKDGISSIYLLTFNRPLRLTGGTKTDFFKKSSRSCPALSLERIAIPVTVRDRSDLSG